MDEDNLNYILLTTLHGLEFLVAREWNCVSEIDEVILRPWGGRGRVLISTKKSWDALAVAVSTLRSVFHAVYYPHCFAIDSEDPLGNIRREAFSRNLSIMNAASTFRVRCRRNGTHNFQSPDVEQAVGGVLHQKYETPVSLKHPELVIRADVFDDECYLGWEVSSERLDRRYERYYRQKVSLAPAAAYGLLAMSGFLDDPGPLADPFCGAGTILM